MINLLLDRLVFNTLSFYHVFPTFGAFVLQTLQQEETLGLAESFDDVLHNSALLDSIRVVRPDFLTVLLFFMLRTDAQLQNHCLTLLKALLESKKKSLHK